jgi:mevalonate kinase
MRVTTSAPGEIFLFGEHAVLYGQPALAAATSLRTTVTVEKRDDNIISINSEKVGKTNCKIVKKDNEIYIEPIIESKFLYTIQAIKNTFNFLNKHSGLNIKIESQLPVGSGLASSSALVVSIIGALYKLFDIPISLENIRNLGYKTEVDIQGAASKIGVSVSTYGGFIYRSGQSSEIKQLTEFIKLPVVIGYTGKHGSTKEMVALVKNNLKKHPGIMNRIIHTIGLVTEAAISSIKARDLSNIGELMNINQGLLDALGVNTEELSALISASKTAGALGAKISGAGGGGCMIAIGDQKKIAEAIKKYGIPLETTLSSEGLLIGELHDAV